MRIAITGASGMIGTALQRAWRGGDEVIPISRRASPGGVPWDPDRGALDASALEGIDVLINLAGENLASGRWTARRKERIWRSRIASTDLLCDVVARLHRPPALLISVSAAGYYGNCGDQVLTEASPPGEDFLARLCLAWEDACNPARAAGIRVAHPRLGMVLSAGGGALGKLLPVFRLGLGGRLGDGRQWMSWIAMDDVVAAMRQVIDDVTLQGPIDFAAPGVVRNAEFAATLARTLRRPAAIPVPEFALKVALGEMAEATILASQRMTPDMLMRTGYRWHFPELESALIHVLKTE